MKEKKRLLSALEPKDGFLVDVALRGVQSGTLIDFLEKVVKPHYLGSLTAAVEDLMEKAVAEEEFVAVHVNGERKPFSQGLASS